jgi:hypothetical protein
MSSRRKILCIVAYAVVLGAVVMVINRPRREKASDVLEVPLGVEEAVIITSDDRPLEPVPFAYGVGLNVRIANMREVAGRRVYDVRYIVNRAGDFDLKDYLRCSDGAAATGVASFKVRGLERLSKDIETRIAETEDTRVVIPARYYETLTVLGVAWIGWLMLLIFWKRKRVHEELPAVAGMTLADQIRGYLEQFESGRLDAGQQARLEMLIFRQWRQERAWTKRTMADSVAAFRADPEVAEAYAELENWLHRSERSRSAAQIAQAVRERLEKGVPGAAEAVAT